MHSECWLHVDVLGLSRFACAVSATVQQPKIFGSQVLMQGIGGELNSTDRLGSSLNRSCDARHGESPDAYGKCVPGFDHGSYCNRPRGAGACNQYKRSRKRTSDFSWFVVLHFGGSASNSCKASDDKAKIEGTGRGLKQWTRCSTGHYRPLALLGEHAKVCPSSDLVLRRC